MKVSQVLAVVAVVVAVLFALVSPDGIPGEAVPGISLAIITIALFATSAVPEYVTALIFFVVAMLLAIAPAEVIFSGFRSTAFWLVFGGLVIGVAIRRTGLAARIASAVVPRFGDSYPALIFGLVAAGVAVAFLMPSTMSRVLILLPIVTAMADSYGFEEGSSGRIGMIVAISFGTMMPGFTILPATVPPMILSGASETLYGITPVYGTYLLLHFPVLGFLKAIVIGVLVVWLFPATVTTRAEAVVAEPMSRDERLLTVLLVAALALWATDFLHGISPAWIALAVAAVCVFPAVGLVPPQAFNERISVGVLLYIAGILGLGALVANTGAGELLAAVMLDVLHLGPGQPARTFTAFSGVTALVATVTTQPAVPTLLTPLSGVVAKATALPIETILMMQAVGFSTSLLIYQTPPLVVAMQLGGVQTWRANKLCLAIFVVTVVLLIPLDYFWWRFLGWL